MPKNKTHNQPQRRASWADVTRARHRGVDTAEAIFLTVLSDKYGWGGDQMSEFYAQAAKLSQEIVEGRINVKDLANVLRDEYQIDLEV
ncbi:MAG: hypothetical protein KBS74_04095 [Clostridiales bacterium]|nr:hypothetical protein [Candidatus Cacconaster stercorequi]